MNWPIVVLLVCFTVLVLLLAVGRATYNQRHREPAPLRIQLGSPDTGYGLASLIADGLTRGYAVHPHYRYDRYDWRPERIVFRRLSDGLELITDPDSIELLRDPEALWHVVATHFDEYDRVRQAAAEDVDAPA